MIAPQAQCKISVQWQLRILKHRHSHRYDDVDDSKTANRLADDRNVGQSGGTMPVDLFAVRNLRIASGFAFCLAMVPADRSRLHGRRSTPALHRRCFSTVCVGNSECGAHYRLYAQATGQPERRLPAGLRQAGRAIGRRRGDPSAAGAPLARPELKTFVALLRAVNVGGTGKLPMSELKAICEAAGFAEVRTFIASGNVIFRSGKSEAQIKAALEASLKAYAGKPVGVLVRTAAELAAVLKANPFPQAAAQSHGGDLPGQAAARRPAWRKSPVRPAKRSGSASGRFTSTTATGMAKSKLRIPAAADGTARNMNTIAKLTALAG